MPSHLVRLTVRLLLSVEEGTKLQEQEVVLSESITA